MATRDEAIRRILSVPEGQQVAMALWERTDVVGRAKDRGVSLTGEQADEILEQMDRKHDCELGITWLTIDCCIDEYKTT